ncbi:MULTISPECIES: PTS N-acetylgalactosamine transporter subunit IIC [unclassified Sporolactobacillus]|uniref:PTS N-acetylgalactosamine transporter subunit IIC n=1 Tax=unclassified Sporolactobacillus TaxID=2628533 RepID=UPI0023688985|nr:PTS N-acetylgalactosamine transporter subunit IIC [Sporolactobacillus sp. CQH2019]MDD9149962.1 PTS N-acetylgalactosamine transporter subunit IIC [Sporolactobacillus sp. CQH2019]
MHVTVIQIILIAVWAGIAGIDLYNGLFHIHRPIVTGAVIGLILGDFQTGLIVGGTLELVWAGMVPLAGAQPPNVVIGGIIGTAFAILTGVKPTVAVGIAVPFAVAVQGIITLLFTAFSPVMHTMDKAAAAADTRKLDRMAWIQPAILFVGYFIISFLPIFFGADKAAVWVQEVPKWILGGLQVAGGMMPAVGFAMLLKIMWKNEYVPFFAFGLVMAAYAGLPILAVAIIGVGIAVYDYFKGSSHDGNTPQAVPAVNTDNDEGGYSNGI